jgi:hypothetical protein
MLSLPGFVTFSLIAFGLVLTPGPNMMYLVSRSICQGRMAGLVSLGGVALGFVFYMLSAAFGLTALLFAVPYGYDILRIGGAAYLLYLAWQAVKPGGRSPFQVRALPRDSRGTVVRDGPGDESAEPEDRDVLPFAAAAVRRSGAWQRAWPIAGAGRHADFHQPERERRDRDDGGLDRLIPG